MLQEIISVNQLNKTFHQHHAVKNLSFSVMKGDVYGFLGPNGAGKSTTIRMLLSLIKPTSGTITFFGNKLDNNKKYLKHIGCIIEKPDFYLYLSAKKNLEIFGNMFSNNISSKRIMEMIELVGLNGREHDKVKTYSHGMKQRLGIAQSLLHDPELIILDEPTTGLDPQGIIDIRNLILTLKNDFNKTIFLSSHILHEIELIANRMIILNKGEKVIEGDVKELLGHNDLIIEIELADAQSALQIFSAGKFENQIIHSNTSLIQLKGSKNDIPTISKLISENKQEVFSITYKRTLEEMFLKLTQQHAAADKN